MDDEVYGGCERSKLARTVATADWLPGFEPSWACPTCRRLAEVVLPALQMLERRLAALEPHAVAATTPAERGNQIAATERDMLIAALQASGGIQKDAAKSLGLSPRTMTYRVKKYHLDQYCRLSWSAARRASHDTHPRRRRSAPARGDR